jgi:hypothetical protein
MNPYLKDLQAFADLLAACNVVEESAVCDAEDYDGEQTLCCIAKAHSRLIEEETAICESLKRERDGLAKALQKVVTAWKHALLGKLAEDNADVERASYHWGACRQLLDDEIGSARGAAQPKLTKCIQEPTTK